ncbi:MAG: two-component regulator propeller domain-containing protein [Pseudomonadota bacterium]
MTLSKARLSPSSTLFTMILCLTLIYVARSDAAVDSIRFDHLSVEDGLSQESIKVIFQDSRGFLWVGTQEGLNKYDGTGFTNYSYQPQNPNSLTSGWIISIAEDNLGNIWIGTNNGLNRLDLNSDIITRFYSSDDESTINDLAVLDLFVDASGSLLVATRKGLNQYLPETNAFINLNISFDGNISNANGALLNIRDIERFDESTLLLASDTGRILFFDETERKITPQISVLSKQNSTALNVDSSINKLLLDSNDRLWIGTNGDGVFYTDLSATNITNAQNISPIPISAVNGSIIEDIIEDKNGRIWFATESGLYFLTEKDNIVHLQHDPRTPGTLSSDTVTSLFIDKSNVMWVGTFGNLNKWNMATTGFKHIKTTGDPTTSLSGPNITAIEELNETTLLIANTAGLDVFDKTTGKITSLKHEPDNANSLAEPQVMSIAVVSESEVWLGYRTKGVSRLNPKTMQFKHYQQDADNPLSLAANGIPDIFVDRDGDIWFATYGGGLSRYNRASDSFINYQHKQEDKFTISSNQLIVIQQTEDDLLWIGTEDQGLNIFNPKTGSNFRINEHEVSRNLVIDTWIWTIVEDPQNNIWIGTQNNGLIYLDKQNIEEMTFEYQVISQQDGLPSNAVFGILFDDEENIWVSTNRGLSKIDANTKAISNFSRAQGLLTDGLNSGAYAKGAAGEFYFGGVGGVTSFDPSQIAPNPHIPPVVITRFQKLNETYNPLSLIAQSGSGAIEIGHRDYLIGFDFAGLDYVSPENNRYKYRLEGLDTEWIDVRNATSAQYTNLPAGKYRFQVIAANSDGVWNEEGASIDLIVRPAPWFSPLAFAFYGLTILAIAFFMVRLYASRRDAERVYREKLEIEVSERTEELRSLNRKLLNASLTDQLTGLHNRRYLNEVMPGKANEIFRKFANALEKNAATDIVGPRLFFIMFDLDGLKAVNDTFGHEAGDKVIEEVASRLRKVCRGEDTIIRWGGDEYMIVGSMGKTIEAAVLAERIRSSIAKRGFYIGHDEPVELTSSIGFAQYPFSSENPSALNWEQVHALADHGLYKSKQTGKNISTGIIQGSIAASEFDLVAATKNFDDAIRKQNISFFQYSSEKDDSSTSTSVHK